MKRSRHQLSSRLRHLPAVIAGSGLCLVALVGCAGGGAQAETAITARPSTAAATTPSPTVHASATPSPSSAASAAVPSKQPAASGTTALARCDVGQLSGSTTKDVHTNVDVDIPVTLTNTGSAACTLQGWPGVSFVAGASGKQVGQAGVLDRSTPHPTVTLQPGGRAVFTAAIRVNQYDNATCAPRLTEGLRVIPPGSTKSLFVQAPGFEACSADVPSIIHIGAITAAAGS